MLNSLISTMEEIQIRIYREGRKLFTVNASPDYSHYGEKLKSVEGTEYREWNPNRSKAAAAVEKGIDLNLEKDSTVLYLGAASGTTVSHFSDIVNEGMIVAVEYSEEVARQLLELAEKRDNIAPILGNARNPEEYEEFFDSYDVVFQDISQRDQAEIFLKNCRKYLKEDGTALISIKARSISDSRNVEEIFDEVNKKLQEELEIVEKSTLDPYEKEHLFVKLRK